MTARTTKQSRIADDYLELIKRFPLIPIKGQAHLKEAFKLIDELSVIDEDKLTEGQADYLMVLTNLVEKYEDERLPIEHAFADGIEILKYLLDQHGMTASDLGRLLKNRQLGAAILRRERQLSKGNIVRLAGHFRVSADLFLYQKQGERRRAS